MAQLTTPPEGATPTPPTASPTVAPESSDTPEQPAASAPATRPRSATAAPRATVPVQQQPAPVGSTGAQTAPPPPQAAPPPPPADDFLDQLPQEAPDGRAAGNALADQYRSGRGSSSSFGSSGQYKRRPRIPPHLPAEQPAVRALARILSAQKAHRRRTGRYGTLDELVKADDLPLTARRSENGWVRQQYRITVTAAGNTFRAEAQPLSPAGRAFYTDDSGFILLDD